MKMQDTNQSISVIVVAFHSADVILGCVESLLAQEGGVPAIVVVDNASPDDTVADLRRWAAQKGVDLREFEAGARPSRAEAGTVSLVHSGANRGFAGGVNVGLALAAAQSETRHLWVLNPDAFADPAACRAILDEAARVPGYGIMGGRVCYAEPPYRVQIDGGTMNFWTGVSGNVNLGRPAAEAVMPAASEIDFVTGASMIASRAFYDRVGPMKEDYFLYYEEADWAMRRGDMPLAIAPDLRVYHHAGTAIGSPTLERLASPFSFWFKYRARMMFVRRFNPVGLPVAMVYATAKAGQLMLKGAWPQAVTLLRAVWGLSAPDEVRSRLSPEAQKIAFGHASK